MIRFPRTARAWWLCLGGCFLAGLLTMAAANLWVLHRAQPRLYTDLTRLPVHPVGLVLGTSPTLRNGAPNPFFTGRIATAARLYQAGKVQHLLVSGDNGSKDYDEPNAMRAALVAEGVPAQAITLDYAGFRTLDSFARARRVFGLRDLTVITDDFHQARSLFLAHAYGIEAAGFPSPRVNNSLKTRLRETIARTWVCLDVYLFRTRPRYYGPPEKIIVAAE